MKLVKRYYQNAFSEQCYPIEHFKKIAEENNKTSMVLLEAILVEDKKNIFCNSLKSIVSKERCGKAYCDKYAKNTQYRPTYNTCVFKDKVYKKGREVKIKF